MRKINYFFICVLSLISIMFGSTKNRAPEEPKLFGAQPARVATNEAARIVPWFAGTRWLGVTWLGEVFNVRTTPVREKVGKKRQTVAYNYYASFVSLISNGPVDRILKIKFDGEVVWSGSAVRGDRDYLQITIANRGIVRFYWGTETQTMDSLLTNSGQEHSAYRGQFYAVWQDIFLGLDRSTVPNIEVEVSRKIAVPFLDESIAITEAGDSWSTYDVNPVAILYDLWVDKRYGMGDSIDTLDVARLSSAAQTLSDEGLALSPLLTSPRDMKQFLIELLENIDAYPTSFDGKLGIELNRPGLAANPPELTDADFVSDPIIEAQSWEDTFDETRVKFQDHGLEGQDNMAKHHELANFRITGRHRAQTVDRPWVVRSSIATKIAGALGRVNALPQSKGSGKLRASAAAHHGIDLGSLFQYELRDGSTMTFRVVDRSEPNPGELDVSIKFESETGWANDEFFSPDVDTIPDQPEMEPEPAHSVRIIDAPYAFVKEERPGLIFFVARGDTTSTAFDIWKASDPEGPYLSAAQTLREGEEFVNFAVRAKLSAAYSGDTQVIDETVGISFEVLSPDESELEDEWSLQDALDSELLAFIGPSGEEIVSLFDVTRTGEGTYTAKCVRGLFDTRRRDHDAETEVWIQLRTRINTIVWPPYVETPRYYKVQTHFGGAVQALADIEPITHTENARALLPITPKNILANGVAVGAIWTEGEPIILTWNNTSRARTIHGTSFNEAPPTDLTGIWVQLWSTDYSELIDDYLTWSDELIDPLPETHEISSEYLSGTLIGWSTYPNFILRCYGVRNGRLSLFPIDIVVTMVEI